MAPGLAITAPLLACALLAGACGGREPVAEEADMATVSPLLMRAERAAAARDFDAAIESYREALELTPWNTRIERALVAAYVARAAQSREHGKAGLLESETDLRTALELAPDDPEVKQSLAVVLLDLASRETDEERYAALRAEAAGHAPDLVASTPQVRLPVERRLDLAFELLERGQLEAGMQRLESLHADYPERDDATRLLAQARVRHGAELASVNRHASAGRSLGAAVELYAGLLPCDGERCDEHELEIAHHNRVVAWLTAEQLDEVRRALDEAEEAGLCFPKLRKALSVLEAELGTAY